MPDYTNRGIQYPLAGDNIKAPTSAAALADILKQLATSTEAAIEGEAQARTRGMQLTTEHLDTVTAPGLYWTRTNAEALKSLGYPFEAYGHTLVLSAAVNDANVTQIEFPSQRYASGFAMRSRYNTAWEGWQYFRPSGEVVADGGDAPASGFKTVPLALTLGQTGADGSLTRHYRLPLNFAAPIPRWRLHIRNYNPRLGTVKTGAVDFTGLWLGKHAGNGAFTAAPTQLRGGFATPADGSEWTSQWFNTPIGNGEYLLSYGYTATTAPVALVGGCWQSAAPSDASVVAPAVGQTITAPFDMWIEAETPATTPVAGMLGDSLSCGVGSSLPVHDSTISQYARTIGALPYHLAASGDSMAGMLGVNPGKVTRWSGLAKPDSILWAAGSNDIAAGASLATLQTTYLDLAKVVAEISPAVYLADIMPRNGWAAGAAEETTRRQYNNWLRTLPGGARDVFAFAASISTDDETIAPAYNADGTHLNTLGYAKNAGSIVRPITSASSSRDSGWRNITALCAEATFGTTGGVYLKRSGNTVWLDVVDCTATANGTDSDIDLISLVVGFRPYRETPGMSVKGNAINGRVLVNGFGSVVLYYAPEGTKLSASMTWDTTDPWPASLPGTAA